MTQTVRTAATMSSARRALGMLPSRVRDNSIASNAIMIRVGLALMGRIRAAFVVKARGGTDEAGDRWPPLSPKTIAYSRTRQRGRGGRTRAEKKRDTHPSQALNQRQAERWWLLYGKYLAIHKGDKRWAAATAWAILKREGAQTLVDKYGHRQVEILRDTGLLLNSLSPGFGGAEQVLRVGAGEVTVGTNREGAADHHRGIPGRLPQRRLWPMVSRWPQSWWDDITEQIKQGVIDTATDIIRESTT